MWTMTKAQVMEMMKEFKDDDEIVFFKQTMDRDGWTEEREVEIDGVKKYERK